MTFSEVLYSFFSSSIWRARGHAWAVFGSNNSFQFLMNDLVFSLLNWATCFLVRCESLKKLLIVIVRFSGFNPVALTAMPRHSALLPSYKYLRTSLKDVVWPLLPEFGIWHFLVLQLLPSSLAHSIAVSRKCCRVLFFALPVYIACKHCAIPIWY